MNALSFVLAGLALAGAALAQATGGGFTGPMTVLIAARAKALPDDAKVTLRGNIESHLGGKPYLFKDASGTVPVEIKSKHWDGQSVSPQDTVQIDGEVDRKRNAVKIEVKHLRKL